MRMSNTERYASGAKFAKIRSNSCDEISILECIAVEELDRRLKEELRRKVIGSEQWYRDPNCWRRVRVSPTYKGPDAEETLLDENRVILSEYLHGTRRVFYGLGTGHTEIIPVRWALKESAANSGHCEVIAVDVACEFLEDFASELRQLVRQIPNGSISYLGIHDLFELFDYPTLVRHLQGTSTSASSFLCFGNTVANFDPDEIFDTFSRNASPNDLVLIGFHKGESPQKAVDLYKSIPGFRALVSSLFDKIRALFQNADKPTSQPGSAMEWRFNPSGNWIEAVAEDTILFRSKRYTGEELVALGKQHGFHDSKVWENTYAGLVLLRKAV